MLTGVGGAWRRVGVLTTTATAAALVAGAAALTALAALTATVAAPPAQTTAVLPGLWVDTPPPAGLLSVATAPDVATHALADTFALHIHAGSTRTIWLDLDGGVVEGTSAEVTRGPPVEDGGTPVTGYVVTRSEATPRTLAADARSHTWSGLQPGATYSFSVLAQNATGYSALRDRTVTIPGGAGVRVVGPRSRSAGPRRCGPAVCR